MTGEQRLAITLDLHDLALRQHALENGIQIAVVKVDYDSIGVDVPEEVARVEAIISHG